MVARLTPVIARQNHVLILNGRKAREHEPLIEPPSSLMIQYKSFFSYESLSLWLKFARVVAISVLLQSCASYREHALSMREGLLAGRPDVALAIAEKIDPEQKEIIISLDKGMLRRINDDFSGSNQSLEAAKQAIEKLYGTSVSENLAAITINDTSRGYEGDRYEQLLLHAYMAMNYIQLGQLDDARVEMLQANVKMMEWGDEPQEDAFLRYLEGIIYENLGEFDNALISYRKATMAYKGTADNFNAHHFIPLTLQKDLLRLLARQNLLTEYESYKNEFDRPDFAPVKASEQLGELVVILNNGLAPIRSTAVVPIFSSQVQQNLHIAFPVYREPRKRLYAARVQVDNRQYPLEKVEDVDGLARRALAAAIPKIMLRATARAVVKYNTQHSAQERDPLAGFLMTVTNLITESADTRSWTTLPQEIQLQRISLPVGVYPVEIQLLNADGLSIDIIHEIVTIKPGRSSFVIKHWNMPIANRSEKEKGNVRAEIINNE